MVNYQKESIHLMASFKHRWSPEFKENWMDACIVNISGSPTGFMPCDQLGEYVIREVQLRKNDNMNPASKDFLMNVHAPQILAGKAVREHFYKATGAAEHYQHSSTVNALTDVMALTEELLRQQVFIETPGRSDCSTEDGTPIEEAVDLFEIGCQCIAGGEVSKPISMKC
jgi:hypothetical protein